MAIIWWWVVWYAIWLYMQNAQIVWSWDDLQNMIAYIFVVIIWLFLLAIAFKESLLPNNRRWVLLLGVGIIWCAHIYLIDTPNQSVYLKDIMKLVGVFLAIVWPMKALQSKEYEEKKLEEEIEIIEV